MAKFIARGRAASIQKQIAEATLLLSGADGTTFDEATRAQDVLLDALSRLTRSINVRDRT